MSINTDFNDFVNSVFGPNSINLADNPSNTNNLIGAISKFCANGDYAFFAANLKLRFGRLHRKFPNQRDLILEKITNLAQRSWMGYYSELVAADFYSLLFDHVELEIPLAITDTLASNFPGRQQSSLDGKITTFTDMYFEVKCLQDTTKTILERIAELLSKKLKKSVNLTDYQADMDLATQTLNLGQIIDEMAAIKSTSLEHATLPGVRYTVFETQPRVLTSIATYTPYRHAGEMETLALIHLDQLVLKSPTILTYVAFPWFNLITNNSEESRKEFTRSFARRVFMKLGTDSRQLQTVDATRFAGITLQVSAAAKYIAFLVFIFDNSVEPNFVCDSNHQIQTMEAYVYRNPNCHTDVATVSIHNFLENMSSYGGQMVKYVDSFEDDNY